MIYILCRIVLAEIELEKTFVGNRGRYGSHCSVN